MSAIDTASPAQAVASAGARAKPASNAQDDDAFARVYDAIGRKPGHGKTSSDTARPAGVDERSGNVDDGAAPEDDAGLPGGAIEGKEPTGKEPAAKERAEARKPAAGELAAEPATVRDASDLPDDLTQLLAVGSQPAPIANDAAGRSSPTALRRDVFPPVANVPGAAEETPQGRPAGRIVVLGRETHFAPIDTPAPDPRATQARIAAAEADDLAPASVDAVPAGDDAPADRVARASLPAGGTTGSAARPAAGVEAAATVTKPDAPAGQPLSTGTAARSPAPATSAASVDAPLPEAGALLRVADQLVAQARELASATAPASGAATPLPERSGGPVRILRLQLQPEELGLVTARLRIVGGVLELRLTADRQQSVEALQRDRDGLIESLRQAGYKAEIASIEFSRPPAAHQAMASGGSGQGQPSGQGSPNGQASGSGSGSGQGSDGAGTSGSGSDQPGQGGASGNGFARDERRDDTLSRGNGDATARPSDEPQAVYI